MATGNTPPRRPTPPRPAGSMHRLKDTPPPQVSGSAPMPSPFQPASLTLPQAPAAGMISSMQRATPRVIPQQMAPAPFLQDQGPAMSFREQSSYFRDDPVAPVIPSPARPMPVAPDPMSSLVDGISSPATANPFPVVPKNPIPSRAEMLGTNMWNKTKQ